MSAPTPRKKKTSKRPHPLTAVPVAHRHAADPVEQADAERAAAHLLVAAAVSDSAPLLMSSRTIRNAVSCGLLSADGVLANVIELGALALLEDERCSGATATPDDIITSQVALMAPHFHICHGAVTAVMQAVRERATCGTLRRLPHAESLLDAAAAVAGAHLAWLSHFGESVTEVAHELSGFTGMGLLPETV